MGPEVAALDVDDGGVDDGGVDGGLGGGVVPLEVLERNLTSHAAHLAAAEAQWLGWLGEYCVREGWGGWGCSGPVQWLSWRCGMSASTARDKVRVALALRGLPVIAGRFAEGRLSYSKVRALTRIAKPESDFELAELGVAATGAQLDLIVRSHKKASEADKGARSAWRTRSFRSRGDDEESTVFTFRVPNHDADLIRDAVAAEVNKTIDDTIGLHPERSRAEVIESRGGWPAMAADAAVALFHGTARTNDQLIADVEIVIDDHDYDQHASAEAPEHGNRASAEAVEPERLAFGVAGRSVAPVVGRRLCCDPRIAALIEDSRGTVLGSGRSTRIVSRRLRRAVERRDKSCCQFPGCAAHRRLHAHHIIHWTNGGPTELHNLILVCSFHHHVVHEGGWNIDPSTHAFIKPDGTTVDPTPTSRFRGSAAATAAVKQMRGPAPLAEARNEPFDLGLVLDSLAYNQEDARRKAEAATRWHSRFEHGPPIPTHLARLRTLAAHNARTARLYDRDLLTNA